MKYIFVLFILTLSNVTFGQKVADTDEGNLDKVELQFMNWLEELNEKGVEVTEDSIVVSKEFNRVMNNEEYRKLLYPKTYTWEQTVVLMQNRMLKQAFWYFINLYPLNEKNKELVIKSVLTYDKLFNMDELMVSAYYTYSFMDPESSIFHDGSPEIVRPDILEAKLRTVQEIVAYIRKNRELNSH